MLAVPLYEESGSGEVCVASDAAGATTGAEGSGGEGGVTGEGEAVSVGALDVAG